MNNYEGMFIVRPDLSEGERKVLCNQIGDCITKNNGTLTKIDLWAEKRKFCHKIKRYREGTYYLASFQTPPDAIKKINSIYRLNEDILRVLITKI